MLVDNKRLTMSVLSFHLCASWWRWQNVSSREASIRRWRGNNLGPKSTVPGYQEPASFAFSRHQIIAGLGHGDELCDRYNSEMVLMAQGTKEKWRRYLGYLPRRAEMYTIHQAQNITIWSSQSNFHSQPDTLQGQILLTLQYPLAKVVNRVCVLFLLLGKTLFSPIYTPENFVSTSWSSLE